ncbi:MAG: acetate kinase, partial [Calditrichaeota bacterium]|nr:acetate kinase [Calditrichota bacterium]
PNHGVIKDRSEINAVGHRVVHGGERFTGSVMIDAEVMNMIHDCIELAPLHNPHNIKGITACRSLMKDVPRAAIFDTAFHHQMPDYSYMYGLPYVLYKRYGVRRYGFHGSSHRYVADRAAEMMGKSIEVLKLVTCHLGNGCSSAAVDGGVSVDTSMGFTPTEGLLMGTRTGDLDPAALLYVMSREEIGLGEANSLINKHSGLQGISGVSNDMRELTEASAEGNERAKLAVNMFAYRVKKYIGAYAASMGGIDGIVFTGGIGENSAEVRKRSLSGLEFIGAELDEEKNNTESSEERFIDKDSRVRIMVIPTNEELVIARDTLELLQG